MISLLLDLMNVFFKKVIEFHGPWQGVIFFATGHIDITVAFHV